MRKGSHHTKESKKRISKGHKGQIAWNKGKHCSEETKEKLRKKNLGKHLSEETKRKIGIAEKGHLTSEETRRKIGLANSIALKGKHHSEETKLKMSKARKGKNNPNYGKHLSRETKKKISEALRGEKSPMYGKRLTKEHIRKCLQRRIPSSLEEKFREIINKYNLPYGYVGNGSFILDGCNPDFINTDGSKIAIEVYAKFYKQIGNRNIGEWKKRRTKIFRKYGWKIIYFDETEVNENCILKQLKEQPCKTIS